jgi:4-hydroxybenzoate polyprenyltransferase
VRLVIGLIQAAHPFPVVAVVSLTALIGVASAGDSVDVARLLRLVLAMLCAQLMIGWMNDFIDQDRDAQFQPQKPIPSGALELTWMGYPLLPGIAAGVGLVGLAIVFPLGLATQVCYLIGLGAGQAYNFLLKQTAFSWLPFVVAFCVLPPFVWSGLDVWDDAFLLLYPIALPLTVAVHIANTLPDIDADRSAGNSGAVVRFGRARATGLLAVLLVLPVALSALSAMWVPYNEGGLLATALVYGILAASAVGACMLAKGRRSYYVLAFRLVAVAGLIFVTGWLASVK